MEDMYCDNDYINMTPTRYSVLITSESGDELISLREQFIALWLSSVLCVVIHTLGFMCTHGHPHISSHAPSQNTLDTLKFISRMLTC